MLNVFDEPIIWLDLETGGTDERVHQITQLGAVVTIGKDFKPFGTDPVFERKCKLVEGHYEQEALDLQNYDEVVWDDEAMPTCEVLGQFKSWAYHATHNAVSKRTGKGYKVAHLGGYNLGFDIRFLEAACQRNGKIWLPITKWTGGYLDVLHLVVWAQVLRNLQFPDLKLSTVCNELGIDIDAHDAVGDVKATVKLAREITQHVVAVGP